MDLRPRTADDGGCAGSAATAARKVACRHGLQVSWTHPLAPTARATSEEALKAVVDRLPQEGGAPAQAGAATPP